MTATAGDRTEETQRYSSTRGIDYDSIPWKLWEKSKQLFWDPADLDFSQDAVDWREMSDEERTLVAVSARGFMVGEEAVTLDIIPLLRCMSDLGRLEDTMYLSMFTMEEAKHTDMFRRWFDAVGFDPTSIDDLVREQADQRRDANGRRIRGIFEGELAKVMQRLDTDHSPEAIMDATLIYNQFVEGVAAIGGYRQWAWFFRTFKKLPGLEAGLALTQRDERRHIAYGTYLGRRIISEHPEVWDFVEQRWAKISSRMEGSYGGGRQTVGDGYEPEFIQGLLRRRLEALRVARTMSLGDVETADVETFVPEELASVG